MKNLPRVVLICFGVMSWGLLAHARAVASSEQSQQEKPSLKGEKGQAGQQNAQGQQAGQGATAPQITPEERSDFQALQNEASAGLDPDRVIQLATDFEKKFPKSVLLTEVYFFGAVSYQQKGNVQGAVEFGEKSLKANPNNFRALLVLASMLPQPQSLQGSDLDKDKKLAEAEADANRALELIPKQFPPGPNETEEQVGKRKAKVACVLHSALGMVHLQRSLMALQGPDHGELAKAEEAYKEAVTPSDSADPQDYYRLGEAYKLDGKADEAIEAFSKASELGQDTVIKTYADQQIEGLKKKKATANPPAKP